MKKVLTIAGSDCSGGAGIQADLKTFSAFDTYGMSVITAITAQNTMGVFEVHDIPDDIIKAQLKAVMEDIFPDSIKIGMVSKKETVEVICQALLEYKCKNIVVDPVMVSTSGYKLLQDSAIEAVRTSLFACADIITPNLFEGEILSDMKIEGKKDMIIACEKIQKDYNGYILLKGGHLADSSDDLLYKNGDVLWIKGSRIANENTHGTGCTLSSAIAAGLAKGLDVKDAVTQAKGYVAAAIAYGLDLGKGRGPLNHNINF